VALQSRVLLLGGLPFTLSEISILKLVGQGLELPDLEKTVRFPKLHLLDGVIDIYSRLQYGTMIMRGLLESFRYFSLAGAQYEMTAVKALLYRRGES
jgi:hypothetical protein